MSDNTTTTAATVSPQVYTHLMDLLAVTKLEYVQAIHIRDHLAQADSVDQAVYTTIATELWSLLKRLEVFTAKTPTEETHAD